MGLIKATTELMPAGVVNYTGMRKFPLIKQIAAEIGEPSMVLILSLLIKDFCSGVNVVRNMTQDQILEAAVILLDEAGTFRLEDYTVMFAMAKRGQLVDIRDRVDLQLITQIVDAYDRRSIKAAQEVQDAEYKRLEGFGSTDRSGEAGNPADRRLSEKAEGLAGAFSHLKERLKENT